MSFLVQGITKASVRYYTISGDAAAINVALLIGVADRAEFAGCIFIGTFFSGFQFEGYLVFFVCVLVCLVVFLFVCILRLN